MKCKKCGGDVTIQMVNTKMKDVTIFRKLIRFFLILMTCGLWLLVPRKKGTMRSKKMCVCQNCGKTYSL
jgi:hypothetical protein